MERGISLTRVCRSKCTIQAVRSLRSGSDDTFNAADWRVRHRYLEHLKSPHRLLEGLIHEFTYQGRDNCCNPSEGDDSHKSKENTGSTLNEHTQGNEYWSYYPRCNGVDAPPQASQEEKSAGKYEARGCQRKECHKKAHTMQHRVAAESGRYFDRSARREAECGNYQRNVLLRAGLEGAPSYDERSTRGQR
jgi:hypothetical protein